MVGAKSELVLLIPSRVTICPPSVFSFLTATSWPAVVSGSGLPSFGLFSAMLLGEHTVTSLTAARVPALLG